MKPRSVFTCQQCGYETPQWYGRCPSCGEWNTMVESLKEAAGPGRKGTRSSGDSRATAVRLSEVEEIHEKRLRTGYEEFDRVMGGGIVPGSVTLVSGEPGIGKSTLLLHVLARTGGLYVTAEESAQQVKIRAGRLGIKGDTIRILATTDVETILDTVRDEGNEGILIVDSVQTVSSAELTGMAGSVGQVRTVTELLTHMAKNTGKALLLVGHVTKDGSIAGPKTLEHMVDTVLFLEGERFSSARILRTLKNRFGAIEEVGIFDMRDDGLAEVTNPSELFVGDRVKDVPGSVLTVIMEGTRPILVEIQALVVPSQLAVPRRVANGFDVNRLQLLAAVLSKRLNLPLGTSDIFVNVSGGIKIAEPASDLAVAVAIISSFTNRALDPTTVVFGELGLLGEIRSVSGAKRRLTESTRLGYGKSIHPGNTKSLKDVLKRLS